MRRSLEEGRCQLVLKMDARCRWIRLARKRHQSQIFLLCRSPPKNGSMALARLSRPVGDSQARHSLPQMINQPARYSHMLGPNELLAAFAAVATVIVLLSVAQALPEHLVRPLLPPDGVGVIRPRSAPLDGLRAFLAIGVVFLHAWALRETYFSGRPFDVPRNPYFLESGLLSVLLFFMITGFLFWNKAIALKGRISPISLYCNRARRILPLYYFLCFC